MRWSRPCCSPSWAPFATSASFTRSWLLEAWTRLAFTPPLPSLPAAFYPTGLTSPSACSLLGGMLGLAFGPLVVLLLASHAGLRFTPLLMIPGVVLATVLWYLLPDDPAPSERPRVTSTSPLLHGPVGPLVLAGTLAAIAVTTFNAGMPLWLTRNGDIAKDSSMIGWTLALFELAAAGGGLAPGWAAARIARGPLITVSMLGAPIALGLTLTAAPGSFAFYGSTLVAGALANAAFPLLVVAAQDRAPGAVAAASGDADGLLSRLGRYRLRRGGRAGRCGRSSDRPPGAVRHHDPGSDDRRPCGAPFPRAARGWQIPQSPHTEMRLLSAQAAPSRLTNRQSCSRVASGPFCDTDGPLPGGARRAARARPTCTTVVQTRSSGC